MLAHSLPPPLPLPPGSHVALLSAKLANIYPAADVYTLIPERERPERLDHVDLAAFLGLDNNVLLSRDLTPEIVDRLFRMPERARFGVVGLDAFKFALTLGDAFPLYLGQLVALSQTTYLEASDFLC